MSKKRLSHDPFFKLAFSDIDVARAFIKNFLPKEILSLLELANLELSNQSFVTPKLKQYFSDLIYQCRTNDGNLIEVALLLMKYIKQRPNQYFAKFFFSLENQIKDAAKRNLIRGMIVYYLQNAEISREELIKLAMTLSGETKKMFMSTYDLLIQEGIEKGIEKGVSQKNKNVIYKGLEEGLSIELLCRLTELSEKEVLAIIQSFETEND